MKIGTIEKIGRGLGVIHQPGEKVFTAFMLQCYPPGKYFAAGQSVQYKILWDGGWEGDGADVIDAAGKSHRAHLGLFTTGRTIAEVADALNISEDAAALGIAGIKTAE